MSENHETKIGVKRPVLIVLGTVAAPTLACIVIFLFVAIYGFLTNTLDSSRELIVFGGYIFPYALAYVVLLGLPAIRMYSKPHTLNGGSALFIGSLIGFAPILVCFIFYVAVIRDYFVNLLLFSGLFRLVALIFGLCGAMGSYGAWKVWWWTRTKEEREASSQ